MSTRAGCLCAARPQQLQIAFNTNASHVDNLRSVQTVAQTGQPGTAAAFCLNHVCCALLDCVLSWSVTGKPKTLRAGAVCTYIMSLAPLLPDARMRAASLWCVDGRWMHHQARAQTDLMQ